MTKILPMLPMIIAAGCASQKPTGPDLPLPTVGWHVDQITQRQIDRAAGDRLVVYHYEWRSGGPRLTDYGERHLRDVARALTTNKAARVTLEPSGDANVDDDRTRELVARLNAIGVADARVIVWTPNARGTSGEEAANVDADTPRGGQTNSNNGGGGFGGGGLGGSGFSSGGSLGGGIR